MTHSELVQKVFRDPVHWPAFGFGLGLAPKAPGTFGSLLGLPIWWFGWSYGIAAYLLLALLLFVLGVFVFCRFYVFPLFFVAFSFVFSSCLFLLRSLFFSFVC